MYIGWGEFDKLSLDFFEKIHRISEVLDVKWLANLAVRWQPVRWDRLKFQQNQNSSSVNSQLQFKRIPVGVR